MTFNNHQLYTMKKIHAFFLASASVLIFYSPSNAQTPDKKTPESSEIWEPQPRIITPGEKPGDAPSDATYLFDGKNLDNWVSADGTAPKWTLKDGVMTVTPNGKD